MKLFSHVGLILPILYLFSLEQIRMIFFCIAIAPHNSLPEWLDPIVQIAQAGISILGIRDFPDQIHWRYPESGIIGAVTKCAVYLRLTLLYLHLNVIKATHVQHTTNFMDTG